MSEALIAEAFLPLSAVTEAEWTFSSLVLSVMAFTALLMLMSMSTWPWYVHGELAWSSKRDIV